MEALKSWALAVCAASVAGSLVHMAAPAGGTEKMLKLTVSLFFLCALLSPVLTGALDGALGPLPETAYETEYNTKALEEEMQRQMEQSFVSSLRQAVQAVLQEQNISPREILINVNTNGQGSISITEVQITLDAGAREKRGEIEQLLTEKLGHAPVLVFLDGEAAAAPDVEQVGG